MFLTAYDEFAVRAFEAEALDYLLKPVTEARFAVTMKRLEARLRDAQRNAREPTLVVSTAQGSTIVPIKEIDWIEAADNYARIWTGPKSYLLRESLRTLERRVTAHGFARAHRCALVRLDSIRKLVWTNGELTAVLVEEVSIPISRRRRAAFNAAFRHRVDAATAAES